MKLRELKLTLIGGFLSLSIFSQQNKIKLSVNAGVNYSSLRFEDTRVHEHDSEIGYLMGIGGQFYFNEKLSIKTELNYEREIVSVFSPETVINGVKYGNYRIYDVYEFLNLPVLLQYEFGNKNPFYINGGAFLGYFLRARERINKRELSDDLSKYFGNFDFGIVVSVGKEFLLSNSNKLILELRNNLGLINIDGDHTYTKTNSFNFIVGWVFVL